MALASDRDPLYGLIPFGERLQQMRKQAGQSRLDLADACCYDRSYLQRLETGSRQPSRDTVLTLAMALALDETREAELLASAGFLPRTHEGLRWVAATWFPCQVSA